LLTLSRSKLACGGHRHTPPEQRAPPSTQRGRITTTFAGVGGEQAPRRRVAASCHTPKNPQRENAYALECVSLLTLSPSKLACGGHRHTPPEQRAPPSTQRGRITTTFVRVGGEQAPRRRVAASCHTPKNPQRENAYALECVSSLTLSPSKLACGGHRHTPPEQRAPPSTQRGRSTTTFASVGGEQAPRRRVAASCHTPKNPQGLKSLLPGVRKLAYAVTKQACSRWTQVHSP